VDEIERRLDVIARPDDWSDNPANPDWTKRTWDLPRTKAEFLASLEAQGITLAEFMRLPAAAAMPERLREALGV
jgi:hypothetical protein